MGETAEWRLPEPAAADEGLDLSAIPTGTWARARSRCAGPRTTTASDDDVTVREGETQELSGTNQLDDLSVRPGEDDRQAETEPTRIVVDDVELPEIMGAESDHRASTPPPETGDRADWFAAGDGELEWPAFARPRRQDHEEPRTARSDRVRYLFPVPDSTDWTSASSATSKRHKAADFSSGGRSPALMLAAADEAPDGEAA